MELDYYFKKWLNDASVHIKYPVTSLVVLLKSLVGVFTFL